METRDEESFNHTAELILVRSPVSELGLLAAKIAYHNFEWRFLTFIMFNTAQIFGLNTFLENYQKTVTIKMGRFVPLRRNPIPQFVIFGEDSADISSTLRWIVKSHLDSDGKFIIVCTIQEQDCDELKIFQTLQQLLILNVVLLKTSHKTKKSVAYSYDFVAHGRCSNYIPHKLDLYKNCENEDCFKNAFPEKLSNFHNCRLIISTIEQPPFMYLYNGTKSPSGIDGDIMKLAANMLNATLVLVTPLDGTDAGHFTNNTWTGSLGDIYTGRTHASVCSAPLSATKYGNFQISFTYYSMDIVWAARLPTQKASWAKLLSPLSVYFRIILLLLFVGIVFINILFQTSLWHKIRRAFIIETPKYSLLFYSWLLFLGMPILRTPARRSFIITVYTWIWFCFVVRSAYQASLINSLKNPAYLGHLESFRDVLKEGYPYGGLASLKEYYYEDRAIYDNWVVVDLSRIYATLDSLLDGTSDFVLASNKEVIKHHLMKYNGSKQLQIIPEKIVNSPTVVYYKKFSPLTNPLNTVLRTAFEAGFIHHTYDHYLDRDKKLLRRYSSRYPESLRMEHFSGCFALLLLGWLLCIIYFAVEYVCGNLRE